MADITHRVTTYYKRAKGETGITQMSSTRVDTADALSWVLADMPEEAYKVTHHDGEGEWHKVTIDIDWTLVPDGIRSPPIPTRNGRRL